MLALSQSTMTLNQALRQIAELKNELHTLRRIVDSQSIFPRRLGLAPHENSVLRTLTIRRYATKEMLIGAMYADKVNGGPEYAERILWMNICSLRKKLAESGVKIVTRHALGYEISEADQNKLRELLGRK